METLTPKRVAIFPWGDVIEAFLDPLGLSAQDFATRMKGGWLFGYVAALATRGVSSVIVYGSERVSEPLRLTHLETGAPIWLVPARRSGGGLSRRSPSLRAALRWARTPLTAFGDILRREGCDALLIQDYEHPRFDALVRLGGRIGAPVFATFQGGDVNESLIERAVRARSLRACRAVIVPSERERRRLQRAYGLEPARLADVANPVDAHRWRSEGRAEARARLGLAPDLFLIVNHGRIDIHRKGLDTALAAIRMVKERLPSAKLAVIGSGQDDEAFAPLVADTPGCTWMRGYVTDPGLIRTWLSAADVYLTLSRIEGMPVAPLEAMACGLPVVSSDAHGLADIFRAGEAEGGILVGRDQPQAAAEALLRLAGRPAERETIGANARRNVEGRYAVPAVGGALVAALAAAGPKAAKVTTKPSATHRFGTSDAPEAF